MTTDYEKRWDTVVAKLKPHKIQLETLQYKYEHYDYPLSKTGLLFMHFGDRKEDGEYYFLFDFIKWLIVNNIRFELITEKALYGNGDWLGWIMYPKDDGTYHRCNSDGVMGFQGETIWGFRDKDIIE